MMRRNLQRTTVSALAMLAIAGLLAATPSTAWAAEKDKKAEKPTADKKVEGPAKKAGDGQEDPYQGGKNSDKPDVKPDGSAPPQPKPEK